MQYPRVTHEAYTLEQLLAWTWLVPAQHLYHQLYSIQAAEVTKGILGLSYCPTEIHRVSRRFLVQLDGAVTLLKALNVFF